MTHSSPVWCVINQVLDMHSVSFGVNTLFIFWLTLLLILTHSSPVWCVTKLVLAIHSVSFGVNTLFILANAFTCIYFDIEKSSLVCNQLDMHSVSFGVISLFSNYIGNLW